MKKTFKVEFEFFNKTQLMLDGNKLAAMTKIFLEKEPSSYTPEDIKKYNQFVKTLQGYLKEYIAQLDVFEQNVSVEGQLAYQTIGGEDETSFISNLDLEEQTKQMELEALSRLNRPWYKKLFGIK